MTREEAIDILNSLKKYYNDRDVDSYVGFDNEDNEAFDMAIKALEQKSCGDCISRKAATDRFDLVQSDDKCMGYDDIMAFLSSLPSVEPERKKGKWLSTIHHCRRWIVCSQCGEERIYDRFTGWNYCPSCGAKMEV